MFFAFSVQKPHDRAAFRKPVPSMCFCKAKHADTKPFCDTRGWFNEYSHPAASSRLLKDQPFGTPILPQNAHAHQKSLISELRVFVIGEDL